LWIFSTKGAGPDDLLCCTRKHVDTKCSTKFLEGRLKNWNFGLFFYALYFETWHFQMSVAYHFAALSFKSRGTHFIFDKYIMISEDKSQVRNSEKWYVLRNDLQQAILAITCLKVWHEKWGHQCSKWAKQAQLGVKFDPSSKTYQIETENKFSEQNILNENANLIKEKIKMTSPQYQIK